MADRIRGICLGVSILFGVTGSTVHAAAEANAAVTSEIVAYVAKYACNALVALVAAMLINFVAVILSSQMRRTTDSEILEHTLNYFENKDPDAKYVSSMETPRANTIVALFEALAKNPLENWRK